MTTSRQERLTAALAWQRGAGAGAPSADDVEIVARLGVADAAIARELILDDTARVLDGWDALQAAMSGGTTTPVAEPVEESPATSEPVAGLETASEPTPAPTAGPAPVPAPEPEPESGTSLTGVARARFEALSAWVAGEVAGGNSFDLPDGTLEAVAQLDPGDRNFAKRLVAQLRTYAPQIRDVLSGATVGEETTVAAPVAAAPIPEASSAPAPTSTSGGARSGATTTAGFAAFDYAAAAENLPAPAAIRFTAGEDEELTISWPPAASSDPVRIFRVVTNPGYAPPSPELGDTIAATFDTEYVDTRRFAAPVLYVAVWLNVGPTEEAARAAQPVLHAQGGCVLPVRQCVVRADGDAVVGQWQAADGVQRIDVERVPKHLVSEYPHYTHDFRLPVDMVSIGGFKDTGAPAGGDFVYRIYALASVGGAPEELSPPVAREVRIEAIIEPVTDLVVERHGDSDDRFDLTWTMPVAGRVEIYRNEKPPASGIGAQVLTRFTVREQGLSEDLRLVQQMLVEDGRGRMLDVPWPSGWSRAYFTPVTVLSEDQLQVGTYQVVTRARALTHVRLVERVDKQFLTFAWPDGVTDVRVYRGPRGGTFVDPDHDEPIFQLNHEEYVKHGGAHLTTPLPPEGCAVHLVATTYARGLAQYSPPVTVDYPGLTRIWYTVEALETQGGLMRRAEPTTKRRLLVKSDSDVTVPLALVHHPERLPLSIPDGTIIERKELSLLPGVAVPFAEQFDVGGHTGFIRLFAHVGRDVAHLRAVLDPPIDELRCGG
jgi:hypothetical protein